jgi:hypothetical protein
MKFQSTISSLLLGSNVLFLNNNYWSCLAYTVTVVKQTWGPPPSCNMYERPMFLPGCIQRNDPYLNPDDCPWEER